MRRLYTLEYHKANLGMTVEEYKFIFWMEYGHRMVRRCSLTSG